MHTEKTRVRGLCHPRTMSSLYLQAVKMERETCKGQIVDKRYSQDRTLARDATAYAAVTLG